MRILHVTQPTSEGVAVVIKALISDQLARGWEVALACPSTGWLPRDAQLLGATHWEWNAVRSPLGGLASECRRIRMIAREFEPTIVHLHSAKAGLSGRLALHGNISTVFQPHAWSFHALGRARMAAILWERLGARWTDLILAVSQGEREEGENAGIVANYEVVPNGVNVRLWGNQDRLASRRLLCIENVPTVVNIGRLAYQKGQDRLLRAWPEVRRSVPDAQLFLVGDGPFRAELAQHIPDGVSLVGASSSVDAWLSAADVAVFPSRWEAGSIALIEAMAARRSVIATDVAGVRGVIKPGTGAIVPQSELESLAREIVSRLTDSELAQSEGRAGRQWIETNFRAEQSAQRVGDVYMSLKAQSGYVAGSSDSGG